MPGVQEAHGEGNLSGNATIILTFRSQNKKQKRRKKSFLETGLVGRGGPDHPLSASDPEQTLGFSGKFQLMEAPGNLHPTRLSAFSPCWGACGASWQGICGVFQWGTLWGPGGAPRPT